MARNSRGLIVFLRSHRSLFVVLFLATAIAFALASDTRKAGAAIQTVTNTNDSGPGSLRGAIQALGGAGGINFDTAGVFATPQTINLSTVGDTSMGPSALGITDSITITGPPAGVTIGRAGGAPNMRLFYVSAAGFLTLKNVTLTNGLAKGGDGGGPNGANSEGGGGGGAGLGGAIFNDGNLSVQNCTLTGNAAQGGNGGNGSGNISTNGGGGGGLNGNGSDGLSGGAGGAGGGGQGGTNTSGGSPGTFGGGGGGGNFNGGCGRRGGDGGVGGGGGGGAGLPCSPPNNGLGGIGGGNGGPGGGGNGGSGGGGGGGLGGAIFNNQATVSITNSTISGNTATGGNGGSALGSGNGGNGGSGSGAGVYSFGGFIVNRATKDNAGTAISPNIGSPSLNIRNSTIANNVSTAGTGGPSPGGSSSNGSSSGGGVYTGATAAATFGGSLIANNTATNGPDVDSDSPVNSQGFNLVGKRDGSSGFTQLTDLTGTIASPLDPLLDPAGLQPNGGPTKTIKLQNGSPAIDQGVANGFTTDQRGLGFPRTSDFPVANASGGDGTDIGAFEVQNPCSPDLIAPTITCPGSVTKFTDSGQPNAIVNPGTPAAADNCALQSVTGVRSDGKPLNAPYPIGTTIITWTARDGSGNTASCSQTIAVMLAGSPKNRIIP